MFLFVGLGNKGAEYENTRHNAGFLALDLLASFFNQPRTEILKFKSSIFSLSFNGEKIICAKPQTFMNLSGSAVLQAMQFYKIPIENIFVFHDDIDLEVGKIKFKTGGGSGGHNGLKSIDALIGNNYNRVRIGVGRPQFTNDVSNFVLSNFVKQEWIEIENNLNNVFDRLSFLISKKFSLINSI
jgi:peptidyl-tRNA hydrolase, PTH1 family